MAQQERPDVERDRDPMDEDLIGREDDEFDENDELDEDEESEDF